MSQEYDPLLETQEPRHRSCLFATTAVILVLALLGSSIYGLVWIVTQRQSVRSEAAPVESEVAIGDDTPAPTAVTPASVGAETGVPPATAAATLTPRPVTLNRIVIVNEEAQLETVAPDGSDRRVLTQDNRVYQFPAWAPDGSQIAAIGGTLQGSGLYVVADEEADDDPQEIYFSNRNMPFYLYWAPDSRRISFLANHPSAGIGMNLVDASGEAQSSLIATGSPFYWNWTAAGDGMLIHSGEENAQLALIDDTGQVQTPGISDPGLFQAPGISSDGRYWAYSQLRTGGTSWLVVDDKQGGPEISERHAGAVALSWSPTGGQLAYISGDAESRNFWGPLRLLDVATGDVRLLSDEVVLAFFWSPDGNKIAYISVQVNDLGGTEVRAPNMSKQRRLTRVNTQQGPHQFALSVVDIETGSGLRLLNFTPSRLFLAQFLPFFDQYALSHRLWSPASDALVLPIREGRENRIMIVPASGAQARSVGSGNMAFWSQQ